MSKTIPADERVQVITEPMLRKDAMTIRNAADGADARIFGSEDAEGDGIPFRTDDELPIPEESGWGFDSLEMSDGIWMETIGDTPTEITILKGVALERNVRRDVQVSAVVTTDSYEYGDGFDYDGSGYPHTVDPERTIQELLITEAGDIVATITTTSGDTFDFSLAGKEGAFNTWQIDSITFKDPNGTTARLAGGWSGE
jgi:hypothetical protein